MFFLLLFVPHIEIENRRQSFNDKIFADYTKNLKMLIGSIIAQISRLPSFNMVIYVFFFKHILFQLYY